MQITINLNSLGTEAVRDIRKAVCKDMTEFDGQSLTRADFNIWLTEQVTLAQSLEDEIIRRGEKL